MTEVRSGEYFNMPRETVAELSEVWLLSSICFDREEGYDLGHILPSLYMRQGPV